MRRGSEKGQPARAINQDLATRTGRPSTGRAKARSTSARSRTCSGPDRGVLDRLQDETEHLPNETAATTIGFLCRARAFFAADSIRRLVRVVTDNGANYTAAAFTRTVTAVASRHQRTRPHTPRHNGKVERDNRILAEVLLYARIWTSEAERAAAIEVWNIHANYHRPHTAAGDQPPASRLRAGVTNVVSQNI